MHTVVLVYASVHDDGSDPEHQVHLPPTSLGELEPTAAELDGEKSGVGA